MIIFFDECHRSQFGVMHQGYCSQLQKIPPVWIYQEHRFLQSTREAPLIRVTSPQHRRSVTNCTYTIVDAINDKNVLPFRVDYIKTMDAEPDMDDKQVWDIDREKGVHGSASASR